MQSGGYGPQGGGGAGSYPPNGNHPPQGSYPPQGNYSAPPTNYNQPQQTNGGYQPQTNTSLKGLPMGGGNMNDVFFGAASCICLGAFVTGFCFLFQLKLVDFIALGYLTVFGAIIAVLDTPFFKTIQMVVDAKTYISKYFNFVTRVTGKGVTFVFLASMLFLTMWDNAEGAFLSFLAVVLCSVPCLVGIGAIVIGILKSNKLDKARRQLQHVIDQRYDQFANTYRGPHGGLTMAEFNLLTFENGGFKFQPLDLKLIFNALVSNPSWRMQASTAAQGQYMQANEEVKIPKQDLLDWCQGGFVFL